MPLELIEAGYDDIYDMTEALFDSYAHVPFVDMVLPGVAPNSPVPRERGVRDAGDRFLAQWKASPVEHWLKVVDTESNRIVSFSRWHIYTENPFKNGPPPVEISWMPEGSREREYATFVFKERFAREARRCIGPYVWLAICGTRPEYRRRGACSLMMQWGIDKADELGIDSYIEGSPEGRLLYEKFGYIYTGFFSIKRTDSPPDEEWKKLEKQWPLEYQWMWRPKMGKQEPTQPYPWGDAS